MYNSWITGLWNRGEEEKTWNKLEPFVLPLENPNLNLSIGNVLYLNSLCTNNYTFFSLATSTQMAHFIVIIIYILWMLIAYASQ